MWLLIMALNYPSPNALATAEFKSIEQCEVAGQEWLTTLEDKERSGYFCVYKDKSVVL